jgi:hypothetical protein
MSDDMSGEMSQAQVEDTPENPEDRAIPEEAE